MESATTDPILTTFQRTERIVAQKSEILGNAVDESLAIFRPTRRRDGHRRTRSERSKEVRVLKEVGGDGGGCGCGCGCGCCCGCEEDEKAEVERKVMALQKIVPGGESLEIDKLFEETAGYILALQGQVKAMRLLASFFEGLEKEKKKPGG